MKKNIQFVLYFFAGLIFLSSCNDSTPEKSFDVAVLNSNMNIGFAAEGMERELESPSMKMGKTKDEFFPMQRSEIVNNKIKFTEENYQKLKSLSQTSDAKDIIQKSVALHEVILPVYRNEYTQLAKLYDSNAPKEEIEKLKEVIRKTYFSRFESLYNDLISSGKVYAKNHNIVVRWAM